MSRVPPNTETPVAPDEPREQRNEPGKAVRDDSRSAPPSGGGWWRLWALLPLLLLALLAALVLRSGDQLVDNLGSNPPPADAFAIQRVVFEGDEIRIQLTNPQRDNLTIATVLVDDAVMPYEIEGDKSRTLGRLDQRTIVVPYDWVPDDPYLIGVTSSTGILTDFEVPAAVPHEGVSAIGIWTAILIGLLVGVVPVALGLLWLPALRRVGDAWLGAFLALTAGLLAFLAVDSLEESLELQARLPGPLGGAGLVLLAVAASYLALSWISSRFSSDRADGAVRALAPMQLALLVAIGIGLHNLGEGLAIGSSFALGELTLGLTLIVGFMVHNVTEGLGIVAPLARTRVTVLRLFGFALVAGLPASLGVVIGRYLTNDVLGAVFFGLAVGAALQVVVEVVRYIRRTSPEGRVVTGRTVAGFVAGMAIMYATGVLAG